jgi:hypothetical protein
MLLPRLMLPLALLLGTASPSLADSVADFTYWHTAMALDDKCQMFKYTERREIEAIAMTALEFTGQYAHSLDGRMSPEDYQAWFDGILAAAKAEAERLGCTAAAEPILLNARGQASGQIYQALVLAFHFATFPEGDMWRMDLSPDEVDAANRYDALLQQIYGDQFQGFSDFHKQQAAARLPAATEAFGLDGMLLSEDGYDKMWDVQGDAHLVISNVLFEVTAELNGWRVLSDVLEDRWTIPRLARLDGSGGTPLPVWYGPIEIPIASGEKVQVVATRMSDRTLRVMTYGAVAREKLAGGVAKLFVRTGEVPAGTETWGLFESPNWPNLVTGFDGTRLDEACLGAPCFSFPAEALDAILKINDDEYSELWLSADAAVVPDLTKDSYLRGRIRNHNLWKLGEN